MVGPWMSCGQRNSSVLLQRIRSRHPVKRRTVLPTSKMDPLNSLDFLSKSSAFASIWAPPEINGSESPWKQNSDHKLSAKAQRKAPLVIRNPVHSRKLEEPIERKREYWSNNLLYIMKCEGLIPKDCEVVMDRPTPEEPYRLSANVVRLLEQEPHLYIAKSNIKISRLHSDCTDVPSSRLAHMRQPKPFAPSKDGYDFMESSVSFESSNSRSSNECCECGRIKSSNSLSSGDVFTQESHSFPGAQTWRPFFAQSRNYSTTAAIAGEEAAASRLGRVRTTEWNPVDYTVFQKWHVGSSETSRAIVELWKTKRQTPRTYKNKLKMKNFLETRVFGGFNYKFSMTGSSVNGYGFDNADVDMCVEVKNGFLPIPHNTTSILKNMKAHMGGMDCFRRPCVVPALCPLLMFTYKRPNQDPIRVDLSVNSQEGIVNSQLLFAYSRMDARVAPLVGVSKHWASTINIRGAQKGFLSSYSLTLMVIYFLQNVKVVPVLHNLVPEFLSGRGFGQDEKLLLPPWRSPNRQDLGSLFQNMLEFYSGFDFQNYCLSVREGAAIELDKAVEKDPDVTYVIDRSRKTKNVTSRQLWGFVNVQEPFNLTNTASALRFKRNFVELQKALKLSHETIQRKGGIRVLLGETKNPDLKAQGSKKKG